MSAKNFQSPGMGNTTDVLLAKRVSVWIEIVPRILAHLGIQHVALASHSAGTFYLLNTLYSCREILDPQNPTVTLLGTIDAMRNCLSYYSEHYTPAPGFSTKMQP